MVNDPAAAIEKYSLYMREVKFRTDVIKNALDMYDKGNSLTGYRESDIELCFLQIRKILELMMLASVVAHHHSGVELQNAIVKKEYNASDILNYLGRINPSFFPLALVPGTDPTTGLDGLMPVEGALTAEEFRSFYNKVCGPYLHASREPAFAGKHAELFDQLRQFSGKIVRLLTSHFILVSDQWGFWAVMRSGVDGDVSVKSIVSTGPAR